MLQFRLLGLSFDEAIGSRLPRDRAVWGGEWSSKAYKRRRRRWREDE
jgi:hypothetical protein